MNSYQRRLRDIKFHKQREKELEEIILNMGIELTKMGKQPLLMPISGVKGDDFVNDIGTGEFAMEMRMRIHNKIQE